MKKMIGYFKTGLLLFALVLASCSKDSEVGPQGPQGEQGVSGQEGEAGPQGEQGVAGEDGADGKDGEDGNAEVYYSNWIPADFTGGSALIKFMEIEFPDGFPTASSIKDTHAIFVYFSGFGDENTTRMLPILNHWGAQFTYEYDSATITIKADGKGSDLLDLQIDPTLGNKFRYIIVPPNILMSGKSSLDYNDYQAVKAHYNIPD